MGFKKTILGLGLAAALSLGMVSGVGAQAVDGEVDLQEGMCAITITSSTMNFGDWKWDGDSYERVANSSNVSTISGSLINHKPMGVCNIQVSTGGLERNGSVIDNTHFSGSLDGNNYYSLAPYGLSGTLNGVAPNSGIVYLRLNDVPNTYAPGIYEGTVTFTVSNG